MLSNLIIFISGALAGAIAMYLVARNSPDHFLKIKGYVDKIDAQVREKVESLKNSTTKVKK